jgi:adenylate cyclase
MNTERAKRKLSAVLSADVKGYSRLMGENEAETVKTLTAYRKIMGELIQQHRGRVIDSPGDNILAEFGSVVDAVQCSVAAQNEFKARNAELPENRRMVDTQGRNHLCSGAFELSVYDDINFGVSYTEKTKP